jgi:hypothetical protein
MIEISESDGSYWIYIQRIRRRLLSGFGKTLEEALVDAEKLARTDLDDIQARLHAERERVKAATS